MEADLLPQIDGPRPGVRIRLSGGGQMRKQPIPRRIVPQQRVADKRDEHQIVGNGSLGRIKIRYGQGRERLQHVGDRVRRLKPQQLLTGRSSWPFHCFGQGSWRICINRSIFLASRLCRIAAFRSS